MSRFFLLVAAALAAAAAIGGSTRGAPVRQTAGTIRVVLREVNRSGQHGLAVLGPHGKTFTLSVTISPPKRFPTLLSNPEHIHKVTCKQYARIKDVDAQYATVVYGLDDVFKGKAKTQVSAPLSKYTTGHYSINVHEESDPNTAVVCGDIPKR